MDFQLQAPQPPCCAQVDCMFFSRQSGTEPQEQSCPFVSQWEPHAGCPGPPLPPQPDPEPAVGTVRAPAGARPGRGAWWPRSRAWSPPPPRAADGARRRGERKAWTRDNAGGRVCGVSRDEPARFRGWTLPPRGRSRAALPPPRLGSARSRAPERRGSRSVHVKLVRVPDSELHEPVSSACVRPRVPPAVP